MDRQKPGTEMTAKEFLIQKYPEMDENWNKHEVIDDNWVAAMMEEYTRHIVEQAIGKVISERYLGVEVANINIFAGHILREIGLITND